MKEIFKCNLWRFLKLNFFTKQIKRNKGCYFYPYQGSFIKIDKSALLVLHSSFRLNYGKMPGSKAESYFQLDRNSTLTIDGPVTIKYGSTIHLCDGSSCVFNTFNTNVGFNLQSSKSVQIGKDCMFGRNVTVFDSNFHPTGFEIDHLYVQRAPVIIGNHVWVGAHSFIFMGANLGDGSIVGAGCFINSAVKEGTTIAQKPSMQLIPANKWARSLNEKDVKSSAAFYHRLCSNETITMDGLTSAALDDSKTQLVKELLIKHFPNIDVNSGNFLSGGQLDSLSVMNLIGVLSSKFNVNIEYNYISPKYLDDIDKISALISFLLIRKPIERSEDIRNRFRKRDGKRASVIECVYNHSISNPDKVADVCDSQIITYNQLFGLASGYASFLKKKGLGKGDIVVLKASQSLNHVVAYLGIHLSGGVATALEATTPDDTIESIAKQLKAKCIISDALNTFESDFITAKLSAVLDDARLSKRESFVFPDEDDSADILFTTGTTGKSKGVELSHKALVATAENLIFGCEYKPDTMLIVPGPLNHANAIRKVFTSLVNGSGLYILNGMKDVAAFFGALDYDCNKVSCCLPPAFIRIIFQASGDKLGEYADKIDFIESASAPLPEPDKNRLCKLLPNTRLYNNYGSSESASVCMYDYNKKQGLKNCVGKAMPNSEILIVDDNRKEINSSSSNMGFLACKGDVNMKGYIGEAELTKEVLDGGVLYTNDVGYIDDSGYIFVIGRKSDVINVGGLKVAPAEVESAVLGYEGIDDCIVIPIDDLITGKALKLLVVQRQSTHLDEQDLIKYLGTKLESYKIPHTIESVDKIARTYNGKLDRKHYIK